MQKKLFFYSNHREDDMSIGISKKVHAELEEFQRRGYITFYSAYCKKGISIFNNEGKELYHHKCKVYDGGLGHWIRRMDNIECAKKFLIKNPVDLVYMRFHFWDVYVFVK